MKKMLLLTLLLALMALTGCLLGPAVKELYTSDSKNLEKLDKKSLLLYKIIIEGDNYDPFVQTIILDKTKILFNNINASVEVDENIFVNNIDPKKLNVAEEQINKNFDYILILIVRTKSLGYSISTLSDENNIYINASLLDGKGRLLTSSLYSKITSYSISAAKRFHYDLIKAINPIKNFITSSEKGSQKLDTKRPIKKDK